MRLTAFADSGDVHIAVENFHVGIDFDLAGQNFTGSVNPEAGNAGSFTHHLERNLLQVQDDIRCVFDDARNGHEFVGDTFDADGSDRGSFNGAQEHAAESVSDRGAETTLEGLRCELAVAFGKRFGVSD